MLKYMLDTNIVIYTLKKRPAQVRAAFEQHTGEMCLSTVTLGELIYGAEKSAQVEHNLSVVANLSQTITVLARGEILAEGPYAEVSRDPRVVEAYMGAEHGGAEHGGAEHGGAEHGGAEPHG